MHKKKLKRYLVVQTLFIINNTSNFIVIKSTKSTTKSKAI